MKEFKGVWIPYEIFTDKNLSDKEKFIYSMIISLSRENTREIALRKITPIIKNDNTYKQVNTKPINNNVKDIQYTNKINNKNTWRLESQRDYSNFDFSKLYANNF